MFGRASGLGQTRRFRDVRLRSGLLPTADISRLVGMRILGQEYNFDMSFHSGSLAAPRLGWARDSYPIPNTRRIVVPFAAGGTADCLGQLVAQILTESMSSTFVVENWPGAGGNVSAEIVAKAPPDGQTLLLGTVGTAVTNQYLYKDISYDCEWSFTPIALVAEVTNVVVVHPSFPASTLREFVEYCKGRGLDKVSYGSPGLGGTGHLAMEYLQDQAGIRLKHVAYNSRSLMIKDLLAGRILIAMDNVPSYLRHIQSGALRRLAVTSARRWFAAPDVPSIAEQGYPTSRRCSGGTSRHPQARGWML